jgi:hypothetical protein
MGSLTGAHSFFREPTLTAVEGFVLLPCAMNAYVEQYEMELPVDYLVELRQAQTV